MTKSLLYQAYGQAGIINECRYSLLRLLATYGNQPIPDVVVYTDQPEAFAAFKEKMPLHIQTITAAGITAWKGNIQFVHRVKIEIIKHCLQQRGGKVIYLDTDTYCLDTCEHLFNAIQPNQVLFHADEGRIDQPQNLHMRKWKQFLETNAIAALREPNALHTHMYNAGLIGLSAEHLPVVEAALTLTDALYPLFPRHTVEQFSFCYSFQQKGIAIKEAADQVFHYWDLKEFRDLLQRFFEKYTGNTVDALAAKSADILPAAIVTDKRLYNNRNTLQKLISNIGGKAWTIDRYTV
ncbi:hypothetical protein [Deminuibacter soli]|uniref:Nucleotide-diphospho-sugar transferase domain-containing protein n=1 Tax=Deminuibacter soli TaxID=2291815 RepID=A0A3E1NR96_9BACT|nr:hypothetical protein [Deminuibacter soli]RFM30461.1 hypothetical protein DXN05_05755 [Deminuibacter soli]